MKDTKIDKRDASSRRSHGLEAMYQRPGFLLKRCHQIAMAIFLEECRTFNITQSQYGCLHALQRYPGIDQIALGRLVGLDRSTTGLVLQTLCDRKLVDRVINRADKRRMQLRVSKEGEKLLKHIAPATARAQARVLSAIPKKSRAAFLKMLELFLAGHGALINVHGVLAPTFSENRSRDHRSRTARRLSGI